MKTFLSYLIFTLLMLMCYIERNESLRAKSGKTVDGRPGVRARETGVLHSKIPAIRS